ncbi:MAG: class I SAM-dependent methyltransferase [Chlamydiota bacterium]
MTRAAASTLKSPKRPSDFRKNSALGFINTIESTWKGHEQFAMWLIHQISPKTVVDLGFDRGLSTIAFAYQNKGNVFGIDWFEEGNYAIKSFALDDAFCNITNALRFNYVKNIHLIIGPFRDVSKTWNRKIDILHIDWAHTYKSVKQHYENWTRYLQPNGVVLIHDVTAYPDEVGRFFREVPLSKAFFPNAEGLGILTANQSLLDQIKLKFPEVVCG